MPATFIEASGTGEFATNAAERSLQNNGIVAFPTETFYGLAVLPTPSAVEHLCAVKDRDGKPIPLIVDTQETACRIGVVSKQASILIEQFWPGPLTLLLEPRVSFPEQLIGPTGHIALRVSSRQEAQTLARLAGGLITSTSANLAGQPPATCVEELSSLEGQLDCVIDGGKTQGGSPSTIVSVMQDGNIDVLREGAISKEQLWKALKT